ncbi:MAG: bacteriohemerythrin [Aquificaceae bacterium]
MGVKFIEITPDLLTGVEEIDQQHENIANHINFVGTLLSQGQLQEAIDYYNNTLLPYLIKHLEAEESFLLSINYPDYEEHKKRHEAVIKQFTDIGKSIKNKEDVRWAISTMAAWLYGHVGKVDKRYGIFYREKQSL